MENEIVVMSVSRVPPMGRLVVGAVGGRYETIDEVDDQAVRQMISAAIAELVVFAGGYDKLVRAGLAPPVIGGLGPESTQIPATLTERQAAFEEVVGQQENALLREANLTGAPSVDEPLSIPDQINPLIQKYLAADPHIANRTVKLEQDVKGNLSVIVDGRIYERPDKIEDPAIRKAIKAALSEWDRT